MHIVLITGISGSGKSVALNVLEDAGYYCVDNLPPALLPSLVNTLLAEGTQSMAVAVDARSAESLASLPHDVARLKQGGHDVKVMFLTATTHSLVARFSETRRSHPLSHELRPGQNPASRRTLIECISEERERLAAIEQLGHVIDTSDLSANKLRAWVKDIIAIERAPLTLFFESFAFKLGVPLDADFVFDVRALPNPYYDLTLRPLTGRDAPVIAFLDAQPSAVELLADIRAFIEKWLPSFKTDNRSYLTVALGCTGGQHRSVYMAERLAQYFGDNERVVLRHREQP
ncbi:RNase adapter RapZ [Janthinobacterium agaricidamnosum]|uniref:p-loop ATPase family protein n=1 Tax=Janthinobacterium agaricidamnosum NBRC 102515 = DSM 9628 TaxID=1349767 RepID=W0VDV9_9BURK|nr:RNase adapter RapZ [Janthinobacterium agaricidamnosum]CDG85467.1 P-loop ATPase family protein [Janthinobacterium agaricidamnosum NBRC 102515 = DSM 9628]